MGYYPALEVLGVVAGATDARKPKGRPALRMRTRSPARPARLFVRPPARLRSSARLVAQFVISDIDLRRTPALGFFLGLVDRWAV
jgi:hypothetical protein